jgi:hypothetical protein
MRSYWVVTEEGDHGSIFADTLDQAEKIFFNGILEDKYPIDANLIEEMTEDWQIQVYLPIRDEDIISIE